MGDFTLHLHAALYLRPQGRWCASTHLWDLAWPSSQSLTWLPRGHVLSCLHCLTAFVYLSEQRKPTYSSSLPSDALGTTLGIACTWFPFNLPKFYWSQSLGGTLQIFANISVVARGSRQASPVLGTPQQIHCGWCLVVPFSWVSRPWLCLVGGLHPTQDRLFCLSINPVRRKIMISLSDEQTIVMPSQWPSCQLLCISFVTLCITLYNFV